MPYKDKASKTAYQRDYMRRKRSGSNSKGLTGSNKSGSNILRGSNKGTQGLTDVKPTATKPVKPLEVTPSRPFRTFSKSAQVGRA